VPDLYPTPTRRRLLADIKAGYVTATYDPTKRKNGGWEYTLRVPGETRRNVSERVDEMFSAGWLTFGAKTGPSVSAPRSVELAADGREIIADGAR